MKQTYFPILVVLFTCLGLAIGLFTQFSGGPEFQKTAQVQITMVAPDAASVSRPENLAAAEMLDVRHDRVMPNRFVIERCLEENDLFNIPTFASMERKQDVLTKFEESIVASASDVQAGIYEVSFTASTAEDAEQCLNGMLATYQRVLEEQTEIDREERSNFGRWQADLKQRFRSTGATVSPPDPEFGFQPVDFEFKVISASADSKAGSGLNFVPVALLTLAGMVSGLLIALYVRMILHR